MPEGATVIVWHRADDDARIRSAYRGCEEFLAATPGLRRTSLLRRVGRSGEYLLVMEWESRAAFMRWERSPQHRERPSPLRPFQDRDRPEGHYQVCDVVDALAAT